MFTVRHAIESDYPKIFSLYKAVAAEPVGIARSPDEITEAYIKGFMEESASSGVELAIENPTDPESIVAEIHCHKMGLEIFKHVFSDLTIAVHPDFQGRGLGKMIFTHLLQFIEDNRPDILRVELFTQESNKRAIAFYTSIGFVPEGRLINRIPGTEGKLEADIPMAWFNPGYRKANIL